MKGTTMDRYLGHGVYASWDGYHVWLAVNHHENKVVALDDQVTASLVRYLEELRAHLKNPPEEPSNA